MTMSTEYPTQGEPKRLALVVARHSAATGCPPGVDPRAFAAACLADSYEVLADLVQVDSGVAGEGPDVEELLWPGAVHLAGVTGTRELVELVGERYDEVVVVPADVPDLPGLVIAKVFKALQRADVCLAPERGSGGGLVAVGLRAPWPSWISVDIDLDRNPVRELHELAPRRGRVAVGPDWHRMRSPAAIQRLDPGLEGWELTRSLLAGRMLHG
jgi:hypothetical protein